MSAPLDELYLHWLYALIADPNERNPAFSHWNLARAMFTKEFVWFIPNDDNRIDDAKYLRTEFADDLGIDIEDQLWLNMDCSMLEVLIGLSRRLAFLDDGEPAAWFWEMITNIELAYSDSRPFPKRRAQSIMDEVIWRTYLPNGRGGLFPLNSSREDQREVELWYQLNSYLRERV